MQSHIVLWVGDVCNRRVLTLCFGVLCLISVMQEGIASPPASTVSSSPVSPPAVDSAKEEGLVGQMIRVSAGSFMMGSPPTEARRQPDEDQVSVTLTRDFLLGRTEVTQAQYQAVMGNNPSYHSRCGGECPVEMVSWLDAVAFTNRLNELLGLPPCYDEWGHVLSEPTIYACQGYRLPTEAEWEYAARAGSSGSREGELDRSAWWVKNSRGRPHRVARKEANAWGFHDMLGNVMEWVQDWYRPTLLGGTDPVNDVSDSFRIARGGSWQSDESSLRVAARYYAFEPSLTLDTVGVRLARSVP